MPRATGILRLPVALLLLSAGVGLLALNAYGLTRSMRSPLVLGDPSDFSNERILSAEEAWAKLDALDPTDRRQFAVEANLIIGQAVKHERLTGTDAERSEFEEAYLTVPVWENYLLHAFSRIWPHAYESYPFTDHRRVLERAVGQCGQQVIAVASFLEEYDYNIGFADLFEHTVALAEVAPDEWYVLDPDFGLSIPHPAEELVARPELVEKYYAEFDSPSPDGYTDLGLVYSVQEPVITYGGMNARRPRGVIIEPAAYLAKWLIPLSTLAFGGAILRRRSYRTTTMGPETRAAA